MDPHAHISYSPLSDMANAADLEAPGHCRLSGPDALRRNLSVAEFKGSALPGRPVFRPKKSRYTLHPASPSMTCCTRLPMAVNASDVLCRVVRWLVLHANGDKQILALDKRHLIQVRSAQPRAIRAGVCAVCAKAAGTCYSILQMFKLDVPIRAMRLLDSSFSNYETIGQISVRDNAIVFSMEHVKAMVMADKASFNVTYHHCSVQLCSHQS